MFYGRNASAFQRLNGNSKEFSSDKLQLNKKQIDSLQKLPLSFSNFLPPLPNHSAVPTKYAKPENVQTDRTKCLTSLFLDNWLQMWCLCWHSVHVWSLRPQTPKPSRFLKDHPAWANHFHSLISNYLLIFWGGISLKKPYMAQLFKKETEKKKEEKRKRKKIDAKNKSVWWQPLPLPFDTTGGRY